MQHTTFFLLPQNSRCLAIEFHEKNTSLNTILLFYWDAESSFVSSIATECCWEMGKIPTRTTQINVRCHRAPYMSQFFCDFFSGEAIYLIYPAVVGPDVNKDYYLPIYYMMIFLRQETLAFIVLYTNAVAYYMYFISIHLNEIHVTKGNLISIIKSISIYVFPLQRM